MTDLFAAKAADWDTQPVPAQISGGVFDAITRRVALSPDLNVLDFGAGTGLICSKLAPLVGRVLAVDVSEAMLAKLGEKSELAGKVETRCQDILFEPLDERVELIVSAMAMHHVEDTDALLRALRDHLVPGGRIALADLDTEEGDFHPADVEGVFHHGFDRAELASRLIAAGFADLEFETAVEVTKDGRRYPVFLVTAARAD